MKTVFEHPLLIEPVRQALKSEKCAPPRPDLVQLARSRVSELLGISASPPGPGLNGALIGAYCRHTGDPDGILETWATSGAPLGILHEVTGTGVFPTTAQAQASSEDVHSLATDPDGWSNYKSAEEAPEVADELLDKMVTVS